MNVFELRQRVINDYSAYVRSFISIRDPRIHEKVDSELADGLLWPEPRIGLNPAFEPGGWIDELVRQGVLHPECSKIFRAKPTPPDSGAPLLLHKHQLDAIHAAKAGRNDVLTTGTGSGKSLAYIVPIVDHVLRSEKRKGIKAIVVYPMNALANSQDGELTKFLKHGYPDGRGPVTFRRYTGQEKEEERQQIIADPPDILLTNYVMLELILTRTEEKQLVAAARGLRFLVLDELHTYRGRQGADVALLVRRTRDACEASQLQHVGTSATMATRGTFEDQQKEVARVATLLFGAEVEPDDVIGETLQRTTEEPKLGDSAFEGALTVRIADPANGPPTDYEAFRTDPLSRWIESAFGVTTEPETGRLVRAAPRPIRGIKGDARVKGAAVELSELTGVPEDQCVDAIRTQLLAGHSLKRPHTGFPVFAFRLHQFISRGDTVFASLEREDVRFLTVHPQRFVPGERTKRLFPLAFCRECGQEYYCVRTVGGEHPVRLDPRAFDEADSDGEGELGYAYLNTAEPWVFSSDAIPEDWLEPGPSGRVKYNFRDRVPEARRVATDGSESPDGLLVHTVPAPFRFCLRCGMAYGGRTRSDFSKLGTLGTEGRSTATTILSLAAVRQLRRDEALPPEARKLLSFTDNRQDASLQAGHFNDFVQVGLLRAALYKAAMTAGPSGLTHEALTQHVFDALALPFELYAYDPTLREYARGETYKALRDVIGYRLYLDLRRGWRITSPNLEQTGLLRIEYEHLADAAADQDLWKDCHPALSAADTTTRRNVCRVLLDFMRKDLSIHVDYLDSTFQERLRQTSNQRLKAPWGIDENEDLTYASVAVPRSERPNEFRGWQYISARGGFGYYLGRPRTLPHLSAPPRLEERAAIISELLEGLRRAALVHRKDARGDDDPGYQVVAGSMRWIAEDGTKVLHDPIRVPRPPDEGGKPNTFFLNFYRTVAADGQGLEAREHTAQVPYDAREEREQRFREGRLPILYCSPTMELGVDIASLNVVNLRNVPPTPANYAQRSGRAGRSGQPAIVITYCSAGSPHDQYFFRRPQQMVSGQVTPPRIDLANEDLVRAHVQAIWLTETGMSLGKSLKDVLDLGTTPVLKLLPSRKADVDRAAPRESGRKRARRVLATLQAELDGSDWWAPGWLDGVFHTIGRSFDDACERWRTLYRAARAQIEIQNKVVIDHTRSEQDRNEARKLRREAEAQLELLTAEGPSIAQSDFYSYRYFASEGFLPGYSFPRLPLSAFIPGRKSVKGTDEFLSRPRFLAISEFGPRNFVYHEGSVYQINRVMLPVDVSDPGAGRSALTTSAKVCASCGYTHRITDGVGPDRCEHCDDPLGAPLTQLFRLQNVATRRRKQINSDEEERQRQGYDLRSTIRFAQSGGRSLRQTASVDAPEGRLATLTYGHAAEIWRINRGWRRRKDASEGGFLLDVERGYWARDSKSTDPDEPEDPMSPQRARVIPFVEDRKNALLLKLEGDASAAVMASLQAALKTAIQAEFQLEDGELAAEPLPDTDQRRYVLVYEAAEGGAGVLRRLVEDPEALAGVARRALDICHFDPNDGSDLGGPPWRPERCEAACYDCLMSYRNQTDHPLLDRKLIADTLRRLAKAKVTGAPGALTRDEQLDRLQRVAASELERRWLGFLLERGYRLPDEAGRLFERARTRCDFFYAAPHNLVVYVDGPPHDFPERAGRDATQQAAMEDLGYVVVRFRHDEDWEPTIREFPSVFGTGKPA